MQRDPLPMALEAEQHLLGALLTDNRLVDDARRLSPGDFGHIAHGALFGEILRRLDSGARAVDAITLKGWAEADPDFALAGSWPYVAQLLGAAVQTFDVTAYVEAIADAAERRRLIEWARDTEARAQNDRKTPAADLQAEAEAALLRHASGAGADAVTTWDDAADVALAAFEKAYQTGGAPVGLTWGFEGLDDLLGGLQPGDLVIVGGRPAMGKTAFATAVAVNAARRGKRIAFASLEMTPPQLTTRIIGAAAGVSPSTARTGRLSQSEMEALIHARQELRGLPVAFSGARTAAGIIAAARRQKLRHKALDLVLIDYLGLVEPGDGQHNATAAREIAAITRTLKLGALALGVPVLLLCQLNRGVEYRDDKRPTLADLRDSGAIEQDADAVLFLYRAEYYLANAEPVQRADEDEAKFQARMSRYLQRRDEARGMAEVIVAKSRHGSTGNVQLRFDAEHAQFTDIAGRAAA